MPAEEAIAKAIASAAYFENEVKRIETQAASCLAAGGVEIKIGDCLIELPTALLDVPALERVDLDCGLMIPSDFLVYAGRDTTTSSFDFSRWSGDLEALLAHLRNLRAARKERYTQLDPAAQARLIEGICEPLKEHQRQRVESSLRTILNCDSSDADVALPCPMAICLAASASASICSTLSRIFSKAALRARRAGAGGEQASR